MNNALLRIGGTISLGIVAVVLFTLLAARVAASPSGVLDACVNPGNGMMRLVDSSSACHNNETFVQWNVTGPQGPAGPQGPVGPQGPQGSPGAAAGGPPFVWVCSPAFAPNTATLGNNFRQDLYVFNGSSSTTANVSVNILDKDGNNLAGVHIPGAITAPLTYPGQSGNATVPVSPLHTLITTWQMPDATVGGSLSVSVMVTSDQPATVSSQFPPIGPPVPCSLLPK